MLLRLVNYLPRALAGSAESPRLGLLLADGVADLAALCEAQAEDCGCANSVVSMLACAECQNTARLALAEAGDQIPTIPLAEVKLFAPVPHPGKLFCLAGNYAEHIRESRCKDLSGQVDPSDLATPRIFMKPSTNTVCGPDAPIPVGPQTRFLDYEGELAVIIGKRGKHIPAAQALSHVGGVTCLNDISERELRIWERPEDRPWDKFFDWLNGKWCDHGAPMGPCAVPLADLADVHDLTLTTRVNGQVRQQSTTGHMIFRIPQIIEYLSQFLTLEVGDVIATGTPSGVGHACGCRLTPGDVVEVEIEPIGVLRNPVVSE